jgi:Flp pilus assembly protein TadG
MTLRQKRGCSGQTLILFTLALVPLLGMLGLVVDIGWAYFRQEAAQTAADAAASAAAAFASTSAGQATPTCATTGIACYASAHNCPAVIASPAADNIQAGCMYARDNGFVTAGRQTVSFVSGAGNAPTASGVTVAYYAIASVREQIPQLFSAALGFPTATVVAQATAGVTVTPSSACIYVLSPSANPAMSVGGGSSITTTQCGIYINSTGSPALSVTGGSSVTATAIKVNGGASRVSVTGGSSIVPSPPTYNAGPVADPLASLVAPAYSGCDHTGYSISSGNTATLNPGVYCGGINMGFSNVTLNPGIYVLNGGGLTVTNGATLTGSNVMLYNTGSAGHTIAPVVMNGGATVTLSAPNSGTYQGVVFFQDRTLTYASPNTISNGASGNITGTFYFPTTEFAYSGGTTGSGYAAFVASKVTITGGSSVLKNDPIGTYTGLANTTGSGGQKVELIQ